MTNPLLSFLGTTITRSFSVDAGHRLINHEGKCRHPHGHTYTFAVECAPESDLDALGRVVDFSVVKELVGTWLDDNLDHGMILQRGDPLLREVRRDGGKVFEVDAHPTAEFLARLVAVVAAHLLASYPIRIVSVRCRETPNCEACYRAAPNNAERSSEIPGRLLPAWEGDL